MVHTKKEKKVKGMFLLLPQSNQKGGNTPESQTIVGPREIKTS